MELANSLKEILNQGVIALPTEVGCINLEERNVMKVEVVELPSNITTVKMRKVSHLSAIKDGRCKQICDYLLVFEVDGKDQAMLVELKKTLSNENKAREQLRRSLPVLEYLRSACAIHRGSGLSRPKIPTRYLLIGKKDNPRFDKQHVRASPVQGLRTEDYKDIKVTRLVGLRVPFPILLSEPYV